MLIQAVLAQTEKILRGRDVQRLAGARALTYFQETYL